MAENVAKLRMEGGLSEWQGMGRARWRPSMLPTDHEVDADLVREGRAEQSRIHERQRETSKQLKYHRPPI